LEILYAKAYGFRTQAYRKLTDHRGVKWITRPMLGFKSFDAAQRTLAGIELMYMIKKKQMVVEAENEGRTATEQFYALAA
jgi:transposase-like protein